MINREVILQFQPTLLQKFKAGMRDLDLNATGKTSESFRAETEFTSTGAVMTLYAAKSLLIRIQGRSPNSTPPPVRPVEEFIIGRGIQATNLLTGKPISSLSLAYALSKSIGKEGFEGVDLIGEVEPMLRVELERSLSLERLAAPIFAPITSFFNDIN